MKTLTAYTNLYSETETIADVRKRGKATRFHPDPVTARGHSRDGDTIVMASIRIPEDAQFLIYRDTERGAAIYGQGPNFGTTYKEAFLAARNGERTMITAVITGRPGLERLVIPLTDFVVAISSFGEELAAA
ncbi:MAG TPA: hypothetical protein VF867_11925 [Arthrobacter sp.]